MTRREWQRYRRAVERARRMWLRAARASKIETRGGISK